MYEPPLRVKFLDKKEIRLLFLVLFSQNWFSCFKDYSGQTDTPIVLYYIPCI